MPEADPAPAMEEKAVANGTAADDVAAPDNKDSTNKEEAVKSMEPAVVNKDAEEQNKGSENGTVVPSDGDAKMAEAESEKEGDAAATKEVDSEDVKMMQMQTKIPMPRKKVKMSR